MRMLKPLVKNGLKYYYGNLSYLKTLLARSVHGIILLHDEDEGKAEEVG